MFANRLKLGQKRKQSMGLRPTKLNLCGLQKADLQNLENQHEVEPAETTQMIKSTPNIQICSPRLFPTQTNTITPFTQVSNRPMSHRDFSKNQPPKSEANSSQLQELSQCKTRLEESRLKLESTQSIISKLASENDLLKNEKKILEAELSNCSKDYYQRQICRLKEDCQKYQIECMTIQHKMNTSSLQKGNLEASNKKRADQIKGYIKQLEKQKLTVVELKNQLNQRQKTFKYALEESQKSNQVLNKSHFELTEKNIRLEADLRQKMKVIDSLTKQNQIVTSRFKQCQTQIGCIRKRYEQALAQKQSKIVSIQNNHRQVVKDFEQKVQALKNDLSNVKENQSSRSIQLTKMSMDIKSEQQNIDKSLKIVRLQEQIKELSLKLQSKDKTIISLQSKLKQYFSPDQYSNLQKKFKDAQDKRLSSAKYYQEKLYNLQKQNEKLKFQKLPTSSQILNSGGQKEKEGSASFNEVLRKTIEETTAIKEQLKAKIEQNQQIKAEIIDIKLKEKKYANQIQILTKRLQSQDKNVKIELEVQKQKFVNDLQSLKRKLHTVETRLQYKISEVKQKDDFIKNTIIGRSKASDVPFIVAELQRIFLERQKLQLSKQ